MTEKEASEKRARKENGVTHCQRADRCVRESGIDLSPAQATIGGAICASLPGQNKDACVRDGKPLSNNSYVGRTKDAVVIRAGEEVHTIVNEADCGTHQLAARVPVRVAHAHSRGEYNESKKRSRAALSLMAYYYQLVSHDIAISES